jgi:hypothetical protein
MMSTFFSGWSRSCRCHHFPRRSRIRPPAVLLLLLLFLVNEIAVQHLECSPPSMMVSALFVISKRHTTNTVRTCLLSHHPNMSLADTFSALPVVASTGGPRATEGIHRRPSRRTLISAGLSHPLLASAASVAVGIASLSSSPCPAWAAPPIAVIAEELGYFPVTNSAGAMVYVPRRVRRESTPQAIEFAKFLKSQQIVMAGTYWCPHTSRQKELFGATAWNAVQYVECAPNGYKGNVKFCIDNNVDGYPAWLDRNGKMILGGERTLVELAVATGYKGPIDDALEGRTAPPPVGGSACK